MGSLKNDMMTDIKHVYINVKFELRKHLKRKRLILVLILAILLPLIFYVVPPLLNMDYSDTANDFASANLGFITLLIIISAALFAGDAISGEFENKTGLLLFPSPQRRTSIFLAKFIAALMLTSLVVSIYYLVTVLEITGIYGASEITTEFIKSYLIAIIYATSVTGILYFLSSIFKRSVISTITGFFSMMMILPIISTVLQMADVEPWFIVTYSSDLVTNVLGTSRPGFRGMTTSFTPDFHLGIAVMVAYTLILFFVTLMIANRKKMEA